MSENLVLGPILPHLAQTRAINFFFKNLAPSVTRYHGQLSSCTISEKTNDLILRKLSDGRTDGQTDESDFIGRCPTNVELPINTMKKLNSEKKLHKTSKKLCIICYRENSSGDTKESL